MQSLPQTQDSSSLGRFHVLQFKWSEKPIFSRRRMFDCRGRDHLDTEPCMYLYFSLTRVSGNLASLGQKRKTLGSKRSWKHRSTARNWKLKSTLFLVEELYHWWEKGSSAINQGELLQQSCEGRRNDSKVAKQSQRVRRFTEIPKGIR